MALKVMKKGIASKSALRHFEFESQILARLKHPCIAEVYEAGTHDDGTGGVPYFAMEYIANAKPITEYASSKRLSTRDRLELFARVCEGIHHGHQKGIIHRDLKPGNILVDASGQPKIIDFGVARATDSDMAVTTLQTDIGQLIGTLQYMSPEQCEADPHALDTRSDVYALGVVLYELLCDRVPYDLSNAALHEAARVIREETPARLSTINRTLRGDVETITLKALEKDRDRRYQSAADLGKDISRYLAEEPIEARPPSFAYQLRLFARRNRGVFAWMATAAATLVLATIASTYFAVREGLARVEATNALVDRDAALSEAHRQAYLTNIHAVDLAIQMNDFVSARRRLDSAPEHLRRWEWHFLHNRLDQSVATLRGHTGVVTSVAFSPDGARLATGSEDKTVKLWDAATGEEITTLRGHTRSVSSVAFSADGARLATGSRSGNSTVKLWDAVTGEEIMTLRGYTGYVYSLAFSPDGAHVATGSQDSTVKIWDAVTGEEIMTWRGDKAGISSVAFSPDGARLATGSSDSTVKLWDAATGEEIMTLRGHTEGVTSLAFSPDGDRLATGSRDSTVKLWDAATGEEIMTLCGHNAGVSSVTFSPDGAHLATGSYDTTVKLWDAATVAAITTLRGNADRVTSLAFSPDGARLATGSEDKTVKLWDAATGEEIMTLRGHTEGVRSLAFSPDGTVLATAGGSVKLWDAATGEEIMTWRGQTQSGWPVAFSPDGTRLATGSLDRTVKLWDAATGEEIMTLRGHTRDATSVAFSPDGARLATGFHFVGFGFEDNTVKLWDAATGEEITTLRGPTRYVRSLAFSPDGTVLATAGGSVNLWDAATGEEITTLRGHTEGVSSVAFSPDGTRLATGSLDGTVKLWDGTPRSDGAAPQSHE